MIPEALRPNLSLSLKCLLPRGSQKIETPSMGKIKRHFFSNLCQICREDAKITCEICHMISYCAEDHRKEDWFDHSTTCRAIYKLCEQKGTSHIYESSTKRSADVFRNLRHQAASECSQLLKRPLKSSELEMLYWPKICGSCYRFSPNLVSCKNCLFAFACTDCQLNRNHHSWCDSLLLFRDIAIYLEENDVPSLPDLIIPSNISSMQEVLKLASPSSNIIGALWSEVLTYPLTVLNILLSSSYSKNLTLHIVGAEMDAEVLPLSKWEIFFLHLLPADHHVTLIFIGPDLQSISGISEKGEINICDICKNSGKGLKYEFICNTMYHDYISNESIEKPILVTALNAGLYRTFGFGNSDSWKLTLEEFFAPGAAPVLITEYTCHEISQDLKLIQSRFPAAKVIENIKINPYASCKPSLNVISDDEIPVIFKNYYYLLVNPQ